MFPCTARMYKARGVKGTHHTSLVCAGHVSHYEIPKEENHNVTWTMTLEIASDIDGGTHVT